jgi:hypothetical protein
MGGYRRSSAGPEIIFENHWAGRKTYRASYWNGSRIKDGIKYLCVIMPTNTFHCFLAGNVKFCISLLLGFN